MSKLKVVSFSDTHNLHDKVKLPKCDIAIFAGDFSGRGNRLETFYFFRWFSKQSQCKYKVAITGNHDICFDDRHHDETHSNKWLSSLLKDFNNINILHNSSINIEGVKIWGSPITPWYHGDRWAFNMRKDEIRDVWKLIPNDSDIVVTHGPVFGILDFADRGVHAGCESLLKAIEEKKPKFHICGHIHEGYGTYTTEDTTYINCSVMNLNYEVANKPVVFKIDKK